MGVAFGSKRQQWTGASRRTGSVEQSADGSSESRSRPGHPSGRRHCTTRTVGTAIVGTYLLWIQTVGVGWGCSLMPEPLSPALATLGQRVRDQRASLGLSQEGLAAASGLHWTFVGQVERGQRNLSIHNLLKLAEALQVDAGVLVEGLRSPEAGGGG